MSEQKRPTTWQDLREEIDEVLTPEEREEIRLRVEVIGRIIEARTQCGYTQRDLESATGLKQAAIARFERGAVDPQLSTILRILKPLGYTLDVVPEHSNRLA